MIECMPPIIRKFGCDDERGWGSFIDVNVKGVMNDGEFKKYIFTNIVPLYLNAKYYAESCVLLKVDSGPERIRS